MEEVVFRKPAVARKLQSFVEARLHCDIGNEEIAELQRIYSGKISMPTFVIIDTETEERLARTEGLKLSEAFINFLNSVN